MKFVSINNDFRDIHCEVLDKNNENKKIRPYYLGLKYNNDYYVLLPLRSNCPRSYSIKIKSLKKRVNPGIDFSKMLFIRKEQVSIQTTVIQIDKIVMKDIYFKKHKINHGVNKTIKDYVKMIEKKDKGLDLNSDEIFLLNRSTLVNFHDIIGLK